MKGCNQMPFDWEEQANNECKHQSKKQKKLTKEYRGLFNLSAFTTLFKVVNSMMKVVVVGYYLFLLCWPADCLFSAMWMLVCGWDSLGKKPHCSDYESLVLTEATWDDHGEDVWEESCSILHCHCSPMSHWSLLLQESLQWVVLVPLCWQRQWCQGWWLTCLLVCRPARIWMLCSDPDRCSRGAELIQSCDHDQCCPASLTITTLIISLHCHTFINYITVQSLEWSWRVLLNYFHLVFVSDKKCHNVSWWGPV